MVCRNGDGSGQIGVSQRNRIEASPGERMATRETPKREPRAFDNAESDEGNIRVLRAGGEIEALRRAESMENRRQNRLVDAIGNADGEGGLWVWRRVGGNGRVW